MSNEFMSAMLENLEKHLTTKTVIGEAAVFGDLTLIPVMDLMFGAGGGSGEGRDEKNQGGAGSGGGMGARLSPKAVIVIKNGEVEVLPLAKGNAIEKIIEAVPALMEKCGAMKGQRPAPAEEAKAE